MKKKLSPAAKAFTIVPFEKLKTTKAWKLTSKLVRLKSKGICYTCDKKYPFEKLAAGHFREKRGSAGIYFEMDGLRAQCLYCNRRLHGNYAVYHFKLMKEIGMERYEKLNKLAQRSKVWTLLELEKIAEEREDSIKRLI